MTGLSTSWCKMTDKELIDSKLLVKIDAYDGLLADRVEARFERYKLIIASHAEFIRDCAEGRECDTGVNWSHPLDCRKCRAQKLLDHLDHFDRVDHLKLKGSK